MIYDFYATFKADRMDTEYLVDILRKNASTLTDRIAQQDTGADIWKRQESPVIDRWHLSKTRRLICELESAKFHDEKRK
tara:strand:+ start:81 stop:317 length:237 start_codon:yes stop_codon:yes gene_type:complete